MNARPRYSVMEHTADVGIIIDSATLPELFANAAYGMFDLIVGVDNICAGEAMSVEVLADDYEELMVNWLSELLFMFETQELLCSEFEINAFGDCHLDAMVRGEQYSTERHPLTHLIKAVTYSGLRIEKQDSLYRARIVFDI